MPCLCNRIFVSTSPFTSINGLRNKTIVLGLGCESEIRANLSYSGHLGNQVKKSGHYRQVAFLDRSLQYIVKYIWDQKE